MIPITLPGRPVTASIDPDALPRYLTARGWSSYPTSRLQGWTTWLHPDSGFTFLMPPRGHEAEASRTVEALSVVAATEGRHPLDLLADLLPPSAAPVAWAHLSDAARAPALAHLDSGASFQRGAAKVCRAAGNTGQALAHEGKAAAYEALAELGRRDR